ncbi:hypothetical protein KFL_001260020 [Klebsormidium nitens]|uniref:Uncharacterized protein n=1 Tax=Klebsormidium nitens TaxID=105231 RepID=A0A1Y1HYM1_KLENI|nr:hypothetical protein KFL_001260020 [Klebsormidium nitens]|eukprot:GAQ82832.1 hypothetical protein KFL_001260020 [Klebsormidium nitens]
MQSLSHSAERVLWFSTVLVLGALVLYQRTDLGSYSPEIWLRGLGMAALQRSEIKTGEPTLRIPSNEQSPTAISRSSDDMHFDENGGSPTESSIKASGLGKSEGLVGIAGLFGFGRKGLPDAEKTFEQTSGVLEQLTRPATVWNSSIVIVPALYGEWNNGWPAWTQNRTLYTYQRTDPSAPRYCQNTGYEAGVFLKFIVDFYEDLPDQTVFLHADPFAHNADIERWIDCLSPDLTYTTLNTVFVVKRSITFWNGYAGFQGVVPQIEKCWRALAAAFDKPLTPQPGQEPVVSFVCCQQIAISRDQIRRNPLAAYQRAYQMIGVNERCVDGSIDPGEIWSLAQPASAVGGHTEVPPDFYARGLESKLIQAQAMEHIIHLLLNDEPLDSVPVTEDQYCQNFRPRSQCPGSPCPR